MMHPSHIQPDAELQQFLTEKITVRKAGNITEYVTVYSDWERPTNDLPDDFITVYMNGEPSGVGLETPYATGYLMVSLYCKMNNDGSVKASRVKKILEQFDDTLQDAITENYHFEYDATGYITPTAPNQSSGYSITTLNLRWTTTSHFETT